MSAIIEPEQLKTEFVSHENCVFFESEYGFLGVELNHTVHRRVILTRALPLTAPDKYISISDVDKNELGIIEKISDFSDEQQVLINKELSLRYFCPSIDEIIRIKEKMGHFYFDVKIGNQEKCFTIKDISKNVRQLGKSVTITDMDANRFLIPDITMISAKSRRILEPYLY